MKPGGVDPDAGAAPAGDQHSRKQFEQRGLPMLSGELVERAAFRMMTYTGAARRRRRGGWGGGNVDALVAEVCGLLGLTP